MDESKKRIFLRADRDPDGDISIRKTPQRTERVHGKRGELDSLSKERICTQSADLLYDREADLGTMQVMVPNPLFIESECDTEPEDDTTVQYEPIEWRGGVYKKLYNYVTGSTFSYSPGEKSKTLREMINFEHFFNGEDALIK